MQRAVGLSHDETTKLVDSVLDMISERVKHGMTGNGSNAAHG